MIFWKITLNKCTLSYTLLQSITLILHWQRFSHHSKISIKKKTTIYRSCYLLSFPLNGFVKYIVCVIEVCSTRAELCKKMNESETQKKNLHVLPNYVLKRKEI